jgi:hypothetical protein
LAPLRWPVNDSVTDSPFNHTTLPGFDTVTASNVAEYQKLKLTQVFVQRIQPRIVAPACGVIVQPGAAVFQVRLFSAGHVRLL